LASGEVLTFGRGRGRDIRFGHDPEDDYVSREAGTLVGLSDGVLVRNESHTQPLVLQAFPGPEALVAPLTAVATLTHEQLRLVIPGRHGARYVLMIDTRGMRPATAEHEPEGELDESLPVRAMAQPTRAGATKLTPREHRLLAALCEPMLILAGPEARPANYREVAKRVGSTAAAVRTCLDELRMRLSDVDGIPGLRGASDEGAHPEGAQSYLPALALWAVHSGVITRDSLDVLPSRRSV
jgi:hypothetical protein